jgi:hypothetical protein
MLTRGTEAQAIRRVRADHSQEFNPSERILEFGSGMVLGPPHDLRRGILSIVEASKDNSTGQ